MVTAFIFANLIIAVVCDAVHVLGGDDVANIIGLDGDDNNIERRDNSIYGSRSVDHILRLNNNNNTMLVLKSKASTSQTLHDLDNQLDHLVRTTNHLMLVVDSLGGVSWSET